MKVTIYGIGYVGLITGICLAEIGHEVVCTDISKEKISALSQGISPIYEKDLSPLLKKHVETEQIKFTLNTQLAANHGLVQFIAVGTPPKDDGSADISYVQQVAKQIGELINSYTVIVSKSTVPTGTANEITHILQAMLQQRSASIPFDVVSNPEFLKEGCAINDFMHPDRIIIGCHSQQAENIMRQLYAPITQAGYPFICMDIPSAELTKYAANAFLAMKVSFINEIAQIAEYVGANVQTVKQGISSDSRINHQFLDAGCGFGGSCFPKDVSALRHIARQHNFEPNLLNATLERNKKQQSILFDKLNTFFKGELTNKVIAIWGLAFKPNTNDIRCATSTIIINLLLDAGACIQAYDPLALENIRHLYHDQPRLTLCSTKEKALIKADCLMIITEWQEFKHADFVLMKQHLTQPVIFDGRNIYCQQNLSELGFTYFGIGIPQKSETTSIAPAKATSVL